MRATTARRHAGAACELGDRPAALGAQRGDPWPDAIRRVELVGG
jgi:hypothetical protein